ncbi:hypothetical protein M758_9G098900 [Ceratodon purpureus]|nr:hypothetical protein M758_9G098900 [Ceratodon purpureus]
MRRARQPGGREFEAGREPEEVPACSAGVGGRRGEGGLGQGVAGVRGRQGDGAGASGGAPEGGGRGERERGGAGQEREGRSEGGGEAGPGEAEREGGGRRAPGDAGRGCGRRAQAAGVPVRGSGGARGRHQRECGLARASGSGSGHRDRTPLEAYTVLVVPRRPVTVLRIGNVIAIMQECAGVNVQPLR